MGRLHVGNGSLRVVNLNARVAVLQGRLEPARFAVETPALRDEAVLLGGREPSASLTPRVRDESGVAFRSFRPAEGRRARVRPVAKVVRVSQDQDAFIQALRPGCQVPTLSPVVRGPRKSRILRMTA